MRTSKYITKYDYIGYYTKQKAMWFFTNAEIKAKLDLMLKDVSSYDFEDLDDEEDHDIEIDAYEIYKEQTDFILQLEINKNIDKDNPKIAEGIILDQASQEDIKKTYPNITKIINFEADALYKNKSLEELADLTLELLDKNGEIILFQPVFINNQLITKPDCFIKENEEFIVIETKGTSSIKKHHLLDIFYQAQVISKHPYFVNKCVSYKMCIVDYVKLKKNQVSFTISPFYNYQKSVVLTLPPTAANEFNKFEINELKRKRKRGEAIYLKKDENKKYYEDIDAYEICKGILLDDLIDGTYSSIDDYKEAKKIYDYKTEDLKDDVRFNKTMDEVVKSVEKLHNDFDDVINELLAHKQTLLNLPIEQRIPTNFIPSYNDKGDYKDNDFWLELRNLYAYMGYDVIKYSGKILTIKKFGLNNVTKDILGIDILKTYANQTFFNLYKNNQIKIYQAAVDLFAKLKSKKVYFDFESINSAIRAVDNSFPFTQTVTQNSIIIDDGSCDIKNLKCTNMIIDPREINNEWFKAIIDKIHHGLEYSYIVYNKSFEASRLKEMAEFINEEIYELKVSEIIKNMYDLADFFIVSMRKQLIVIPELKGFYSIKKVLPIIEKEFPQIYHDVNCLNYKELSVGNGLVCQTKTTKRFFNTITDLEWEQFVHDARIYCENDVRAMIAVEYFIKKLIDEAKMKNLILS